MNQYFHTCFSSLKLSQTLANYYNLLKYDWCLDNILFVDCCFIFYMLYFLGWVTSKVVMPQLGDYFQYKIEITIPYLKYAYEAQVSTCLNKKLYEQWHVVSNNKAFWQV